MSTPKRYGRSDVSGFTLIELVIVIVVIGIMAAYAYFDASPAELSLPAQADKLASNLRHTQALANAGIRMRFHVNTGTNGSYSADCVEDGTIISCPQAFSVQIEKGVVLDLVGTTTPATFDFNTLGEPRTMANAPTAAAYTLSYGGSTMKVTVAAVTGHVSVTP